VSIERKIADAQGIKHSLADANAEHSSDEEDADHKKP